MSQKKQFDSLLDKDSIGSFLSCLIKNPLLVPKYPLEDFDLGVESFKRLYRSIVLLSENFEKLTIEQVELFSKKLYQEDSFINGEAFDWLKFHEKIALPSTTEVYWSQIKKYSYLRNLEKNNISTKELVDFTNINFSEGILQKREKLEKMSLEEVMSFFRDKLGSIENPYKAGIKSRTLEAKVGMRDLKESLKEFPDIGRSLQGEIYSTIGRGARLTKYFIRSGASGTGKSRTMVGDLIQIGSPYRFNWETGEWEDLGPAQPVLFVTTELDFSEVQTLLISCISGVNEEIILNGEYESEIQESIVDRAIQIVEEQTKIIIEYMPDPCVSLVSSKLRELVREYDIKYVWYDYIHSTPALLSEFRDLRLREDVVLLLLSSALKELSNELGVFIATATQVSGLAQTEEQGFRGLDCIRGSKAIADKSDYVSLMSRVTPEDLEMIQPIIDALGCPTPNVIIDISKVRRSRFVDCRIFTYIDLGTCRQEDLFVTDKKNNPLNIKILRMDYDEEENKKLRSRFISLLGVKPNTIGEKGELGETMAF